MRGRLINKQKLTIRPIDRAGTEVDPESEAPRGHLARDPEITVFAQVDELANNTRRPGQGGANLDLVASLTFYRTDLVKLGWEPRDGDLVVQIANRHGKDARPVRWYLQAAVQSGVEYHNRHLITATASLRPQSRKRQEGVGVA